MRAKSYFTLLASLFVLSGLGGSPAKGLASSPTYASTLTRAVPTGKLAGDVRPGWTRTDRLVVKFREGSGIRLRGEQWVSLDPSFDLSSLKAWIDQHPGVVIHRHFLRGEEQLDEARRTGEALTGTSLADLNLYYRLQLPPEARNAQTATEFLSSLRRLPMVEVAFAEPIPQPAAIDPGPPTPDFTGYQGYLGTSPVGVNAQAVWGFAGGRGAGVKLIDIEGAWLWTHEDLKTPFFEGGTQINDPGWRNHGTAVMGEMVGANNGFGVTGISCDLQVGGVSIGDMGVATALDMASANLQPGDLFLIELHAAGPNSNGSGQFGYVPMEFWQDNFDVIQTAVANGRICIEAGGNGEQNLDDPVYHNLFNRNFRNSGAILVGAGTPNGLDAEWFTNYGSRLDLQGWGSSVTTCGYGDLQGGAETQWYTGGFGGTSSASPIVAGSVASLQGMSEATWGISLSAPLALQILFQTGSPWAGSKRIGNRPNLVAARTMLLQGIGLISGVVRDAGTNQPISGADVYVTDMGSLLRTDSTGAYSAPVLAGTHNLQASDFYHAPSQISVPVSAGEHVIQDIVITAYSTGAVAGTVLNQSGAVVPSAPVRIVNTPIPIGSTDLTGMYQIAGIPIGLGYKLVYGPVPTRGSTYRTATVAADHTTWVNPILVDAQTFESSNGSYTPQTPWQWGTPSVVGPPTAFSGTKLWATNLSGNYGDNVTAYLTSPAFDFSGATRLTVSFAHWYDMESGFDGGNLQVHSGSSWITVSPVGGYPEDNLGGLGYESGYSGISDGWQPAVFDLTAYIGNAVQIRFHFGSDPGVNGPGWYVDDVAFDTGFVPLGVEFNADAGLSTIPELRISPNPFLERTTFQLDLRQSAQLVLRIYGPDGRCLRSLIDAPVPAGLQSYRWDGRDANGRDVPRGVYFCEMKIDGRRMDAVPLIRIR